MKITSAQMTIELQAMWPSLKDIWLMDSAFVCPTYNEMVRGLNQIRDIRLVVEKALADYEIKPQNQYIENRHDCDNFALELRADVSRYGFDSKTAGNHLKGSYSMAFGSVSAMLLNGREVNHTFNFCRTSNEGIIFIEPRDFSTWKASKTKDWPYYMVMG